MNNFVYLLIRIIAWPVVNICLMPKLYNKEYFKVTDKCILIANHTTYWDPILIGHLIRPKNTRFMAKVELINNSFARKFLTAMGIVPVARGKSDLKAIKSALKVLKNNDVLGIFPEGTRSKTGELLPFESGVTVLSSKTNTPILPIYIHKNGIHPGHRVKVIAGKPFYITDIFEDLSTNDKIEESTEYLRNLILELKKQVENG